jgi:hypothetical protein
MMTARQYFESRSSRPLIRQAGHRKIQRGFNTETMATLTAPEKTTATEHPYRANGHVGLLTREKVANIEWEAAVIFAPAQPAAAPALPQKEDLMAKIVRPFVSLYRELSGPPMTEHDRHARVLAEAKFHDYTGFVGY